MGSGAGSSVYEVGGVTQEGSPGRVTHRLVLGFLTVVALACQSAPTPERVSTDATMVAPDVTDAIVTTRTSVTLYLPPVASTASIVTTPSTTARYAPPTTTPQMETTTSLRIPRIATTTSPLRGTTTTVRLPPPASTTSFTTVRP